MGATVGLLVCSAYCLGLFVTSLWICQGGLPVWSGVGFTAALSLLVAGLAAVFLPRIWLAGPRATLWLSLGLVGLLAAVNYGWQYPTPSASDISHVLSSEAATGTQQEVSGWIEEMPKLARSGKGQFWLKANSVRFLNEDDSSLGAPKKVQGNLYVTVSADNIRNLYPGQRVTVRGQLYLPTSPKNPNAFNFQQYLASRHCYAGLSGKWVNLATDSAPPRWALWQLRNRIANAHAAGLGERAGALVSAMALDRRAVQIPYDLQDAFIQAGLAHALAASGFHVSLLLGVVLGIMANPSVSARFANPGIAKLIIGSTVLAGYVLLTGGQPSIMRAAFMGVGALVGIALERRVKPLGCLLLAATLLLVWQPIWVDDVGFRLSVMATFGLIVGVKPLTERLEWLPTSLTTVVAVSLVAYFWTIPLSLYYFNTLTTYSILLNIVVTPLITLISLGGIFSGLVAVLSPHLGGALAWLLWLPTHLLIWLVNWEISLPGSALATGHISLLQMVSLYGLYGLGGWQPWWKQHRWLTGLIIVLIAMGPLWYRSATLAQITVLAAGNDSVMVVQDHRSTLLVNSGTDRTAFYTIVPFLRQAGVNRLAYAIAGADSDRDNWQTIIAKAPVQNFYNANPLAELPASLRQRHELSANQPVSLGHQTIEALTDDAKALKMSFFNGQSWLLLSNQYESEQLRLVKTHTALHSEVLWWDGGSLADELLVAVQPKIAIASAKQIDTDTAQKLSQQGIQVFCTEQDGAIIWAANQGYRPYLNSSPNPRNTWE